MEPRGIRNNNPLNIEKGQPWQGLRAEQTDPRFAQFTSLEYGFRAAFRIIKTYLDKRNPRVDTVAAIINRWAPPSENDTQKYIDFVCERGYLEPNERIVWKYKNQVCRLVWAMAAMECGRELSFGRIENAYEMAKR